LKYYDRERIVSGQLGCDEYGPNGYARVDYDMDSPRCSPSNSDECQVYIAARDGERRCKVGFSKNPTSRARTLGRGVEIKRAFPVGRDAYDIEQKAHSILVHRRDAGEWFNVSVADAQNAVEQAIALWEYERDF
tara:strand:+ start:1351 stop:1752 length:402 start_codon:yes stop_codon:yes gene_type:complete